MFTLSGLPTALGPPIESPTGPGSPSPCDAVCRGRGLGAPHPARTQRAQAAAAALAVFYYSPLTALVRGPPGSASPRAQAATRRASCSAAGELWGYVQTAIAIGLFPVDARASRSAPGPEAGHAGPLIGGAAARRSISWIHPWQGVTQTSCWPGSPRGRGPAGRATRRSYRRSPRRPPRFYAGLARWDAAWNLAAAQNEIGHPPASALVLAFLPWARSPPTAALGVSAAARHGRTRAAAVDRGSAPASLGLSPIRRMPWPA